MIYVVADTNALIAPFKMKFNIDIELTRILGSYTIIIPEPLIGELRKLAVTNMNAKGAMKFALGREIFPTKGVGDNSVLELARKMRGYVMTNDIELIERARKRKLRVIRLREGCRLELM